MSEYKRINEDGLLLFSSPLVGTYSRGKESSGGVGRLLCWHKS